MRSALLRPLRGCLLRERGAHLLALPRQPRARALESMRRTMADEQQPMSEETLAEIRARHEQLTALLLPVENPPANAHTDRGLLLAEVERLLNVADREDTYRRQYEDAVLRLEARKAAKSQVMA